ncbi:MAG TPA: hypothetical protein VLE27_07925, partial [Thermoanaerobaculia bacterium]|nr:hypothetical protein [Thermoanaerobaculia bacterium]
MSRKLMVWIALPLLLTFLYGCPKKKPATTGSDLDVETTTVPAPAPSAPATDVEQPAAPDVDDQPEIDPLASGDLAA